MKKYSKEWKNAQSKKHGGWAQKHGDVWAWHYIQYESEYTRGVYYTKKSCEEENNKTPRREHIRRDG